MAKFNVYFTNETGMTQIGERHLIYAESASEAIGEFLRMYEGTGEKYILTSSGLLSSAEIHVNPNFREKTSQESLPSSNKSRNPVLLHNEVVAAKCAWSVFCSVVGWLNIALGLIGLLMLTGSSSGQAAGFTLAVAGFAGGIASHIAGYIIQLLFDCRGHLKEIAKNQNTSSK